MKPEKKDVSQEKLPYDTPKLTVHGDVEEITQYVSGENTDQFDGSAPG
jgi:hypothetical protein